MMVKTYGRPPFHVNSSGVLVYEIVRLFVEERLTYEEGELIHTVMVDVNFPLAMSTATWSPGFKD